MKLKKLNSIIKFLVITYFYFIINKNSIIDIKEINIYKIKNKCNRYYKNIKKKYYNFMLKNEKKKYIKDLNLKSYFGLKVAICVIAKQENIYIKEFINYYLNLGIKTIFLYDNNDLDGENFEDILDLEIKNGLVIIINYRGFIKPQKKAFDDCYLNNKYNFDWIGFYDVDEYLYIENYTNINQFLSLSKFKNCSSILINWKNYGDNDYIRYKPKPIQNRFIIPFNFKNGIDYGIYLYSAAKSIIRGGLNITWEHFPHFLNSSNICYPNGTFVIQPLSPPQYSSAYLKHYITKSTEEYVIKLIKGTVNSNITINKESILFWINNYYFIFNKITKKKLQFLEGILKFKIIPNKISL